MKALLYYPGSKKWIASWIIENMPDHHSYLYSYFGGGGMFFEKTPSNIDVHDNVLFYLDSPYAWSTRGRNST